MRASPRTSRIGSIRRGSVKRAAALVSVNRCRRKISCPSRTTILRGQYSHNTQVFTNNGSGGGFEKVHALGLEERHQLGRRTHVDALAPVEAHEREESLLEEGHRAAPAALGVRLTHQEPATRPDRSRGSPQEGVLLVAVEVVQDVDQEDGVGLAEAKAGVEALLKR